MNARGMTPQELQNLLDELKASRASRRRAWENLQEIRWVLTDSCGVELPPPARKTIDSEGRIVKDGVRKALRDRQLALAELVHAIRHFRQIADSKPLTLRQRIPTGRSGVELGPTVFANLHTTRTAGVSCNSAIKVIFWTLVGRDWPGSLLVTRTHDWRIQQAKEQIGVFIW
jgi:hypothetical protein